VSTEVLVATIAAVPPTLAALVGYMVNSRSIRRSVGAPSGIPLVQVIERLEGKIDGLVEGQATIRERLARVEGGRPRGRIGARRG
jgi:hypothetical protein